MKCVRDFFIWKTQLRAPLGDKDNIIEELKRVERQSEVGRAI